jgi:hypothetical protein
LFDASVEALKNFLIWTKLSNLSLEFWFDKGFKAIGDSLGTFIVVDVNFKSSSNHSVAHILMEMDLSERLFKPMKLIVSLHSYSQFFDYLNVLFRCVRCRHVGHVVDYCDKKFVKKF